MPFPTLMPAIVIAVAISLATLVITLFVAYHLVIIAIACVVTVACLPP
jgi:hypothetical protein